MFLLCTHIHFHYFSDSTWKWYSIIWPMSQSTVFSGSIQVVANGNISFFSMAMWFICHLSIYHIFLVQSFVNWHSFCFPILTIVVVLLWILGCVHLFKVTVFFFPDVYPGVKLLCHMVNPPANAGDLRDIGSIPGSGRSPGGGHYNPLQYSWLESPHGQRSLGGCSP